MGNTTFSLVSELYYHLNNLSRNSDEDIIKVTKEKIEKYAKLGVTVAEFGTRSRHFIKYTSWF